MSFDPKPSRPERCDEKVTFGTWAKAERNAKWMNRVNRERASAKRVHVYQCPWCGGIHVGGDSLRRKSL